MLPLDEAIKGEDVRVNRHRVFLPNVLVEFPEYLVSEGRNDAHDEDVHDMRRDNNPSFTRRFGVFWG